MEPPPGAPGKTAALLDALWQRKLPLILERLAVLERAAAAGEGLDPALREHAAGEAHKLAGVLGTFGLPEGTTFARALEEGLETGELSPPQLRQLTANLRKAILSRLAAP